MKFPSFLAMLAPALVGAQTPAPLLIDPEAGRSPIVIERFASPAVDIVVGFVFPTQEPPQITADVFLDGGSLLAPMVKDLPFKSAASGKHPYLTKGSFTIPLKNIEKPLNLRVIFKNGATPPGEKAIIGHAMVRVTPPGALETLLKKRVLDSSRPMSLVVFGKAAGLREMLTGWHVPFVDGGPNPPGSTAADTLMIGETDERSHLPVLTPQSSLFVVSTDPRQDSDSEIYDSNFARSTIVRSSGNIDWQKDPGLHRLFAAHLSPH